MSFSSGRKIKQTVINFCHCQWGNPHDPPPPTRIFSCEDFLFDEEKNSLLSTIPPPNRIFPSRGFPLWRREKLMAVLESCDEFSLCQRGNPLEENFLVGGGRNVRVISMITLSHEDYFFMRISYLMKRKTHCSPPSPPLPRRFFPHEEFLFDEEKNSWLS